MGGRVCWRGNYVKVSGSVFLSPPLLHLAALVWGVLREFPQLFRRRRRESLICFYFQSGIGRVGGFSVLHSFSCGNLLLGLFALAFNEINYVEDEQMAAQLVAMKMKCHLLAATICQLASSHHSGTATALCPYFLTHILRIQVARSVFLWLKFQ